jgi:TolB-like protein
MPEERPQRRLAAILAADVVGYSRLMGANEERTLAQLQAHQRDLLEPSISEHRGRIVKTTGDGMLAEFASVVDALRCATEIQKDMTERNAEVPTAERIEFRIGINVGDIMSEGGDIFGDGVNVAARLEGLADPGGICVSGRVQEDARGKFDIPFEDVGEQRLKNIAWPVRVYKVRLGGETSTVVPALSLPDKPSIAVLPFTNMSGDPEQEYFADGVVEEIITALSRMRWLFVIARNSSFTYKRTAVDVRQVGRELGVRYVLEGSVRKAADRIRISSQLVDTASGAYLWTDRFDGRLQDIFDLQDRITASVVGAIEPKLRHAEMERAREKPTENMDAYDLFLRALALHNTRNLENSRGALRLLDRAIAIDQRYASAYALAAYCIHRQRLHGWLSMSDPLVAEGVRMARLAAERGQDDPEALWMAGLVLSNTHGDSAYGLPLIERSLALNPNSANAWMASGNVRAYLGETETAIAHLERSAQLSPLDPLAYITWLGFGYAHFMAGRYEEASSWCDRALHEAPNHPQALRMKIACCGLLGHLDEGRRWVERLVVVNPNASMSNLRAHYQIVMKKPGCLEALVEGLRKAGLPE